VEAGKFRQDLYYRLNVIELGLPPLRERKDDIGLLAQSVLRRLSGDAHMGLAPAALDALRSHSFPGNVRELENILERALAFASGHTIEAQDLALKPAGVSAAPGLPRMEPAAHEAAPAAAPATLQPPQEQPEPLTVASGSAPPRSLSEQLDVVERRLIQDALARSRFNRTEAADLLGLTLRQLRYRMRRLHINEQE
jgi:two-component system response regulator PilR (NtrC family)